MDPRKSSYRHRFEVSTWSRISRSGSRQSSAGLAKRCPFSAATWCAVFGRWTLRVDRGGSTDPAAFGLVRKSSPTSLVGASTWVGIGSRGAGWFVRWGSNYESDATVRLGTTPPKQAASLLRRVSPLLGPVRDVLGVPAVRLLLIPNSKKLSECSLYVSKFERDTRVQLSNWCLLWLEIKCLKNRVWSK